MTIAIVGLGYVGLPLACAFARKGYDVIGFDIAAERIKELTRGHDRTSELQEQDLKSLHIAFTVDPGTLRKADVMILAIPTPVDGQNKPDLSMLRAATDTVGRNMKKGAIVVYESTVYPGVTEDDCGAILERVSRMQCGRDFTLGYSPERVNPGDREHTVETIVKIVAAQDEKTLETLARLYGSIITAGIHRAPSIKVAEMAKAIENAQRDLNIAFINEVALLCHRLGIRTKDVLEAAATKWNFLPFHPGLVGGHCIGVDPYYLVEMAEKLGVQTQVITAGRVLNDRMSREVASAIGHALKAKSHVLVLGLTFKENVADTRNSKSFEVVEFLMQMGHNVAVHDPHVSLEQLHAWKLMPGSITDGPYDALILLVPHRTYCDCPAVELLACVKKGGLVYDLKSVLDTVAVQEAGRTYLAL